MSHAADSSDPPAISSHARKCLLITPKKKNTPHTMSTKLTGPIKLTGTKGVVNLVNICTIVARLNIRCPSNSRSASSTSGLLAPTAQTSVGRASCSCLPWPAAMRRRPHRPLLLPPLARPSLYSPTPPVILQRRQPHTAENQ